MENVDFYISGLAVVLSIFLLAVNMRAYRRSHIRMFAFIAAVFIIFLIDGLAVLIGGLGIVNFPITATTLLLVSDIAILVLFYYGVVRGS